MINQFLTASRFEMTAQGGPSWNAGQSAPVALVIESEPEPVILPAVEAVSVKLAGNSRLSSYSNAVGLLPFLNRQ